VASRRLRRRQRISARRPCRVTVPATYHDAFMDAVAPHLKAGQIVLI
jgi:hypothetical protein